jgi:excisionase family DNA binding protein
MDFENPEEWITAREAADRKGIHRNNIARAIREGRLKGVMVGGRYLMRCADVEWSATRIGCPTAYRNYRALRLMLFISEKGKQGRRSFARQPLYIPFAW